MVSLPFNAPRREFIVRRYPLSEPQFVLLSALQEGANLGEALAHCVEASEGPEDFSLEQNLGQWFQRWTAEGCFFASVEPSKPKE